uniref:Uncharacterized protein n=1 Tax=Mycena chlorophos TaxID=658473 RepID=A0ABQ0L566_MYCCL|nr:predicted protein [Mycena chlorophos]
MPAFRGRTQSRPSLTDGRHHMRGLSSAARRRMYSLWGSVCVHWVSTNGSWSRSSSPAILENTHSKRRSSRLSTDRSIAIDLDQPNPIHACGFMATTPLFCPATRTTGQVVVDSVVVGGDEEKAFRGRLPSNTSYADYRPPHQKWCGRFWSSRADVYSTPLKAPPRRIPSALRTKAAATGSSVTGFAEAATLDAVLTMGGLTADHVILLSSGFHQRVVHTEFAKHPPPLNHRDRKDSSWLLLRRIPECLRTDSSSAPESQTSTLSLVSVKIARPVLVATTGDFLCERRARLLACSLACIRDWVSKDHWPIRALAHTLFQQYRRQRDPSASNERKDCKAPWLCRGTAGTRGGTISVSTVASVRPCPSRKTTFFFEDALTATLARAPKTRRQREKRMVTARCRRRDPLGFPARYHLVQYILGDALVHGGWRCSGAWLAMVATGTLSLGGRLPLALSSFFAYGLLNRYLFFPLLPLCYTFAPFLS